MRRVKFKIVRLGLNGKRYSIYAGGRYNLEYPKDVIVRARRGTLGVFVYQTRKQAKIFLEKSYFLSLKIIRVRPVGRGKIVKDVCYATNDRALDCFYQKLYSYDTIIPPLGTIIYPAVEVLE